MINVRVGSVLFNIQGVSHDWGGLNLNRLYILATRPYDAVKHEIDNRDLLLYRVVFHLHAGAFLRKKGMLASSDSTTN